MPTLAQIDAKLAQLQALKQKTLARQSQLDRKARTRRAIILGETILTLIDKGQVVGPISEPSSWLAPLLKRDQDRKAWGLPPIAAESLKIASGSRP